MSGKIDKGRSMLNAADETANPYGLILSEKEREIIFGQLNRLDNTTDALLHGKTGWKQQVKATSFTIAEFVGLGLAAIGLHNLLNISTSSVLAGGIAFLVFQKFNLLLTDEGIEDTHSRRNREADNEAKERAQYFKDMGCEDRSLEE